MAKPRTSARARGAASLAVVVAILGFGATPALGVGVTGIDLALPVGTTVSGQVFDELGAPASDVGVGVCANEFDCFAASTRSAADGSYTIQGIEPGSYLVMAIGSDPNTVATFYGGPGTSTTDPTQATVVDATVDLTGIDITLDAGLSLSGTLRDPAGNGVTGIFVSANGPVGGGDTTAADGTYEITGLIPGFYEVQVSPPQESPFTDGIIANGSVVRRDEGQQIEITADVAGFDASLVVGAMVSGTIAGLARPADISVEGPSGGRFVAVDAGGAFVVQGLWPDAVSLIVHHRPIDPFEGQFPVGVYDGTATLTLDQNAATTIDLSGGNMTDLALAAPVSASLVGTITDSEGGVPSGFVNLCSDELGCGSTIIGADGSVGLWNLPPGTFTLFVASFDHPSGYATASGGITDDFASAGQITIDDAEVTFDVVLPVGQTIAGTITGPSGEAIEGASVSAGGGGSGGSATTDANGDYVIRGLAAGDYRIRVNGPEGGPYLSGYWSEAGYTSDFEQAGTVTLEPTAPGVVGTEPGDGATGVARTTALSISYSGSVDVSGAHVELRQVGVPVATQVTVAYDDGQHVLTIRPRGRLHGTATYVLEVSGVTARDGTPVGDVALTFTTRR